jgi:hypothetical protein
VVSLKHMLSGEQTVLTIEELIEQLTA